MIALLAVQPPVPQGPGPGLTFAAMLGAAALGGVLLAHRLGLL